MTAPPDLAAIRARLDAAVQGPYTVEHVRATTPGSHGVETSSSTIRDGGGCWICEVPGDIRTAEFLAAARTDVGDLLDECERLQGELADADRMYAVLLADHQKIRTERDAALAEVARLTAAERKLRLDHMTEVGQLVEENARLRAERLAEDAVVEAVERWADLYRGTTEGAPVLKTHDDDVIATVDALRAARAGKEGG